MTKLAFQAFLGTAPVRGPKLLENNQAQDARNCDLGSGELRPYRTDGAPGTDDATLEKTGTIRSIYLFDRRWWMHWTEDVDVAGSPVHKDTEARTYFTVNDGATTKPQMTDATLATSGTNGKYPTESRPLGVPAPTSSPSATNTTDSCDAANNTTTAYVYTYVTVDGEEGPPSEPSALLDRCDDDTVDLSNMATAPAGGYDIDRKRLYRAATSGRGTEYMFVAELDVAATTYSDTVKDRELGEVLPSTDWYPPPDDLQGLVMLPNGIAAGFVGKDLYLSEQYLPHAWPDAYVQTVEHDIVGLGVFGQSLVVCTEGQPYLATGTTPASYTAKRLPAEQGCVSKRSIVGVEGGVLYASPDGLVLVSSSGAQVVTSALMDRRDWQDINPSSLMGAAYNGKYFGFYDTGASQGALILDLRNRESGLTWTDDYYTAAYSDLLTDQLYLVDDAGNLVVWDAGGANRTATWRSKVFPIPYHTTFSTLQVIARSYAHVVVRVYADGALRADMTVTGPAPVRLPGGFKAREWEVEIETQDVVQEVYVAEAMRELAGG